MTDLITIESQVALNAYDTADGVELVVSKIEEVARSFVFDISTAAGRKDCASIAAKIARSKTLIDDCGKSITEEWKAKSKIIDNMRKMARERLDALKAEVRKPLTDFEEAEAVRVSNHQAKIAMMQAAYQVDYASAAQAQAKLDEVQAVDCDSMQEFAEQAKATKSNALLVLQSKLEKAIKNEADAAELEKLRAERAEQERLDREVQIAERAAQAERERAEKEAARVAAEEAARAADVEHRRAVNGSIVAAMVALGVEESTAKEVIKAIYRGDIPNVSIKL